MVVSVLLRDFEGDFMLTSDSPIKWYFLYISAHRCRYCEVCLVCWCCLVM
jgi:hypothetical protein